MSWLDKVNTDFVITTGDSKNYQVNWLNASKSVDYNVTEFEFPEVDGTFVYRARPKGRRFSIEIYFQGEDHLDIAEAFEASAADPRAWTISHPYYSTITVQPLGLSFDNSIHNITKVTGTIVETILDTNPRTVIDPVDQIQIEKEALDFGIVDTTASVRPAESDITLMDDYNRTFYSTGKPVVKDNAEAEAYFNAFNKASSGIAVAISKPAGAIQTLQSVINGPALFTVGVKNRIDVFDTQFSQLRSSISNITKVSSKGIYFALGSSILSALCLATSKPIEGDYTTRDSVLYGADKISKMYADLISDTDSLQSKTGGKRTSFMPPAKELMRLNQLVSYTLSNLFVIALGAKQERSLFLEDDSNIILLAHRLYGLDAQDASIDLLVEQNGIAMNELYQIRKGRKIVYYV